MRRFLIFLFIIIICTIGNTIMAQNFKAEQLKKSRVKQAYNNTTVQLDLKLDQFGLKRENIELFLRGVKYEKKLEVWIKHRDSIPYKLFKVYDFCVLSGNLGPKTAQGDLQVPEGFYHIDRFNAWSTFHLSLGINYPNLADKKLNGAGNLGGDIFIHGDCVSIGCIPITNTCIEELYVLAMEAKNNGQTKLPVHVFPFKMTKKNMDTALLFISDEALKSFWENLKQGFFWFEEKRNLPEVKVSPNGNYLYH